MGLAPRIVREGVENAKRGDVQLQREPHCGVSLLIGQRARAPLRNSSTCFSFSGFAFKVARMPTVTSVLIWIAILLRLRGCELWTYESC